MVDEIDGGMEYNGRWRRSPAGKEPARTGGKDRSKMKITAEEVYRETEEAVHLLLKEDRPHLNPVKLLVVGASSSEIAGGTIGHDSSFELGGAVAAAVLKVCGEAKIDAAFQCCEHLNRALIMERKTAEKYRYEIVRVIPQLKAGGSLATAAWKQLDDPVAVLAVQADAGIDIGLTLIGMHLKRVAVPLRVEHNRIGNAIVNAARTRPMLIGGERAVYRETP